jgi:hypothetical protein
MRRSSPFLLLFALCFTITCSSSSGFGTADIAPRVLNLQGNYDWIDSFDNPTACMVRIFWQDDAWRGWVRTNHENVEICPWEDYELPRLRMRGDRVRMSIACPRSGCPSGPQRATAYLLDVVPGVMLSGTAVSAVGGARWHTIRLVRRPAF